LLKTLLLLFQSDDSLAVSPNFEDSEQLKDPKCDPLIVICSAPLMANAAVISEVTLNAAPEYENTLRRDPRLRSTDAVTAHLTPTPFAARHTTSVSFCHWVDAHAVAPIRTPPVQSDSPALAPYTDTLI
jgi:hypothetical protein